MFMIRLNKTRAAVLLRCLRYGQNADSGNSDFTKAICEEINQLREEVCQGLSQSLLDEQLLPKE